MEKGYIVCVDDESAILSTLSQQLKDAFGATHNIETANSAEEAMEIMDALAENGCSLEMVISDQVMPGMKGDELLARIHTNYPDTIKILLTGQAGFTDVVNAVNKGGLNYFVAKPWDGEALKVKLREFLKSFRETIENQRLIRDLENRIASMET